MIWVLLSVMLLVAIPVVGLACEAMQMRPLKSKGHARAMLVSRLPCHVCGAEWGEPCDAGLHS